MQVDEDDLELMASLMSKFEAYRKFHSMSQMQLCENAGISISSYRNLVNGNFSQYGPGLFLLCRVSKVLGVNFADALSDRDIVLRKKMTYLGAPDTYRE